MGQVFLVGGSFGRWCGSQFWGVVQLDYCHGPEKMARAWQRPLSESN